MVTTPRHLSRSWTWRVIGACASTAAPHNALTAAGVVVIPRHVLSSNSLHATRPLCLYSYFIPHPSRCSPSLYAFKHVVSLSIVSILSLYSYCIPPLRSPWREEGSIAAGG